MIKFAERLKELRTEKGLSQRLAKETRISQNAILFGKTKKEFPMQTRWQLLPDSSEFQPTISKLKYPTGFIAN